MKVKEPKENKVFTEQENITRKKHITELLLCLINALFIEIYFIAINGINNFAKTQLDIYVKILYMIVIFIAVIIFEIAYKKEKKSLAITGVELIVLATHTLLVGRNITLFNENNVLSTSYVWLIYYSLKAIMIYTIENRRRLKQISDISEIVKEEKPAKKVAKKRKK